MKLAKCIQIFIPIIILANTTCNCFADSYYSDYSNEPSTILKSQLKLKLFATKTSNAKSSIQASPQTSLTVDDNLISGGFGADIANVIFLTNHVAAEMTLGFYMYKIEKSVLNNVFINYATQEGQETTCKAIYSIPLDLIAQYHFAPYGGFSPYAGIGYSFAYFINNSKAFDINQNTFAPILQIGINFIAQDNTLFSFEIKKYFLSTTVSYKASFLGLPNDSRSKTKVDPLIISAGVSFEL